MVAQDSSARESLQTFLSGKGDVALTYENEAITAQQKGEKVDYVIPPQTILIQNPTAVTSDSKNPKAAVAFRNWLWTPQAQKVFVAKGYRSSARAAGQEEVPGSARPVHDRQARRLEQGQRPLLRPAEGRARQRREVQGRCD